MFGRTELIAAGIIAVFAFGGGYKLKSYQVQGDALKASQGALASLQKELIAHDLISASDAMKSRTLEETLALIHDPEPKIIRETEYVKEPVYTQCVVPPNGVRLVNDAIAARHRARDTGKR